MGFFFFIAITCSSCALVKPLGCGRGAGGGGGEGSGWGCCNQALLLYSEHCGVALLHLAPAAPRTRSPVSRRARARWRPSPAAAQRSTAPRCPRPTPGTACPARAAGGGEQVGAGQVQGRPCAPAAWPQQHGSSTPPLAPLPPTHLEALALVLEHVLHKQHGAVAGGLGADLGAAVLLAAGGRRVGVGAGDVKSLGGGGGGRAALSSSGGRAAAGARARAGSRPGSWSAGAAVAHPLPVSTPV